MIVADASVVVDLLLGGPSPAGDALAEHLVSRDPVAVPHLLDVEVTQVIRRYTLAGSLTAGEATTLVDELGQLPLARHAHGPLLARAFELRTNVTVYDAVYLALAELLEAPLLTADGALADVPGCTATVTLVRTGS